MRCVSLSHLLFLRMSHWVICIGYLKPKFWSCNIFCHLFLWDPTWGWSFMPPQVLSVRFYGHGRIQEASSTHIWSITFIAGWSWRTNFQVITQVYLGNIGGFHFYLHVTVSCMFSTNMIKYNQDQTNMKQIN